MHTLVPKYGKVDNIIATLSEQNYNFEATNRRRMKPEKTLRMGIHTQTAMTLWTFLRTIPPVAVLE
jgi:hypothetical protein